MNYIPVKLSFGFADITLWQHDFGVRISLDGPYITAGMPVQWSYPGVEGVDSRPIMADDGGTLYVVVPDAALRQTEPVTGYIYIFDETSGRTRYTINITIRPRPSTEDDHSEDDTTYIGQLVERAQGAAVDAEAAKNAAVEALVDLDGRVSNNEQQISQLSAQISDIPHHIDFPSIVLFGDSITQMNGAFNATTGLYWEPDGYFFWTQLLSKGHWKILRNAGTGGNTTTQMLARLSTDVLAYPSDYVFVLGGVNDVDAAGITAETTISNLTNIYSLIKANGSKLIIATATPSDTFTTDDEHTKLATINHFIRNYAYQNADVIFCDFFNAVVDTDCKNIIASLTVDGTHPNEAGAKRLGTCLYNALQKAIGMSDEHLLCNTYNDPSNVFGNASLLIGDTNGVADGWTVAFVGASVSKNFYNGELEAYNEQVVTTASPTDGSMYMRLSTDLSIGEKVQGMVRVKFENLVDLDEIKLAVYCTVSGVNTLLAHSLTNIWSAHSLLPNEAIYTTPIGEIPAGTTKITVYINAKNLHGTMKVSSPTLRILP